MSIHTVENFGEFLVEVGMSLFVLGPLGEEPLHAFETGFVKWLENVKRGKDECARPAGGVEHRDSGDFVPQGYE